MLILSKVITDPENRSHSTKVKIGTIFDIVKGKAKYTKSYMNKHKGKYPVFSSQTSNVGIIANINTYDHDCECLTWTTDGTYVGTVFLRCGKFSMTSHCGALFLKEEFRNKISLDYMYTNLNNILPLHMDGEGSNKRLGVNKIAAIQINIPIDENNNYDIEEQKRIAKRYSSIKTIKENIKLEREKIENIIVIEPENTVFSSQTSNAGIIANNIQYKLYTIGEIFDLLQKTNNSKFTKTFIEKHKGIIPVYSASKDENAVDYGYIKDNLEGIKYFKDCLTWNIDGSIGKIFFRQGKFSLSEKVIPLILQENFKNCDLLYLKYTIENELASQNFGFTNKAGKSKIQNIKIKIPITPSGKFDLQKQKEIAEKYRKREEIKRNIKAELEKIENIKVDISI